MESVHGKGTAVQNGGGVVQLPNTGEQCLTVISHLSHEMDS